MVIGYYEKHPHIGRREKQEYIGETNVTCNNKIVQEYTTNYSVFRRRTWKLWIFKDYDNLALVDNHNWRADPKYCKCKELTMLGKCKILKPERPTTDTFTSIYSFLFKN
jgi:hypothetical protein